jgi:hypothetical protein
MSYRLVWLPSARDAALQIILTRPDRAAIVAALDRLTRTLQHEGPAAGESREVDFRVTFDNPLAVKFSVDEADRAVTITDIWTVD